MRSLTLFSATTTELQNTSISATTIDLDEKVIYATSERQNLDGTVEVEIWKAYNDETSSPTAFTMFSTVASPHSEISQVVSFHILPELRQLSIIMQSGDIMTVSIEDDGVTEVEGTVEPGIYAASWSPDDSLLVLISGEDKLILMTSNFDVLSEMPIHTTDFGENAPINVGWGSKQTQFHGSLGKSAAQAPTLTAIGSSPDDDAMPRISWRGDGAYFVVSVLSPPSGNSGMRRRTLRIYDREARLQSTSEPLAGFEHSLVWRPSGSLIAGTQRFGFEAGGVGRQGRHDVVFFERNGLRHGEFEIRVTDLVLQDGSERRKWGYKVRELSWSSDSNVLAIWIERDGGDIVQLWTIGNYHWYLKQEVTAPACPTGQPARFTSVSWHPEQALHMILTTRTKIIQRTYAWETFVSHSKPPLDSGAVAVFDGSSILLTPFRVQNVPPPMSSCRLVLSESLPAAVGHPRIPVHASFSSASDALAVLWESGYAELWSLQTRLQGGGEKVMDPTRTWSGFVGDSIINARQIYVSSSGADGGSSTLTVLWADLKSDYITATKLENFEVVSGALTLPLPYKNCRLVTAEDQTVCQGPNGQILKYDLEQQAVSRLADFPAFCLQSQSISMSSSDDDDANLASNTSYVGLDSSGKLYAACGNYTHVLATNATSFTIASGFIIFTTTAHEAIFIPLTSLRTLLNIKDDTSKRPQAGWETRRVERGSRIVVAVPSGMCLVLQMPRGNLETINPRPLVMEVVKRDINSGNYRKAFFACRKHRIDLNILVDHDQASFLERISSFVDQIHEVDHLNLFLTGLGRGSRSSEAISRLCDAVRTELESRSLTKYVNSILTAYVVKTPPDHEAGLALLLRLRENDPTVVEDAVKYIIFLVDADRLFDTALGMYDFSLVLMIAQHAQKDPREYLPFLRELRALEKYYQRFRIDDHLKRYESALRNLSLAGSDHFDEAVTYIDTHRLYEAALRIWKDTDRYQTVLELYGDWLFERREFRQAASVFVNAQNFSKAMVAHEKALEWQEFFYFAARTGMSESDVASAGYRIAEDLASKKRHSEAARVLLDYSKDIREAVVALVQGNQFSEACRITTIYTKPELIEDIIHPGALESCAQILEDLHECQDQLRKQLNRIRELRIKKIEEPDAYYGTEDINLHNIDVMTDVSMAPTAFTRYTVAPTSASRSSKRSSRSKRKMERKVGSGRKGTVDEEMYLYKSVTKLVARFPTIQDEARGLLPHLLQFTVEHHQEGLVIQQRLTQLGDELKTSLDEIWPEPTEETLIDSWAFRMEEAEREKKANPVDKVAKPDLPGNGSGWRINLFDFK